jgi:hypothetical protein
VCVLTSKLSKKFVTRQCHKMNLRCRERILEGGKKRILNEKFQDGRKTDKEAAVLTSSGRDLNIVGAATRKPRVAICSLYLGTVRRLILLERRLRDGV